jgi:hypothetical protein
MRASPSTAAGPRRTGSRGRPHLRRRASCAAPVPTAARGVRRRPCVRACPARRARSAGDNAPSGSTWRSKRSSRARRSGAVRAPASAVLAHDSCTASRAIRERSAVMETRLRSHLQLISGEAAPAPGAGRGGCPSCAAVCRHGSGLACRVGRGLSSCLNDSCGHTRGYASCGALSSKTEHVGCRRTICSATVDPR